MIVSKEWPRLCTDSVVRNILSGAQTQDRRPLFVGRGNDRKPVPSSWDVFVGREGDVRGPAARLIHRGPRVGAALWVRETWALEDCGADGQRVIWRADMAAAWAPGNVLSEVYWLKSDYAPERWRPSIHLSRWACRLVLPITRVWVERIQDISEEDAAAEGALAPRPWDEHAARVTRTDDIPSARRAFRRGIWEPLYPGSWERNDWVLGVEWSKVSR